MEGVRRLSGSVGRLSDVWGGCLEGVGGMTE